MSTDDSIFSEALLGALLGETLLPDLTVGADAASFLGVQLGGDDEDFEEDEDYDDDDDEDDDDEDDDDDDLDDDD